jgi:hypothetical protein
MEKRMTPQHLGNITAGLSQVPPGYVAPNPPTKVTHVHVSQPNAHSLHDLSQAMKAAPNSTTFTVAPDIEANFTKMILSPTLARSDGKGVVPNPHYSARKVVVDPTMPAGTWKLT